MVSSGANWHRSSKIPTPSNFLIPSSLTTQTKTAFWIIRKSPQCANNSEPLKLQKSSLNGRQPLSKQTHPAKAQKSNPPSQRSCLNFTTKGNSSARINLLCEPAEIADCQLRAKSHPVLLQLHGCETLADGKS